jgi:hypothetical protein
MRGAGLKPDFRRMCCWIWNDAWHTSDSGVQAIYRDGFCEIGNHGLPKRPRFLDHRDGGYGAIAVNAGVKMHRLAGVKMRHG